MNRSARLRIFVFLLSIGVHAHAQNFSIVSDEVKAERQTIARNKAYHAKVEKIWKKAVQKNTVKSLNSFIKKGYNSKHNKEAVKLIYNYFNKDHSIKSIERFLSYRYPYKEYNDKAKTQLFKLVAEVNTIKAYDVYLKNKNATRNNKKQAIANIYMLTVEIDAMQGYRDFLKKYPKAPDAKKATERLYEILYAIAEEENEIATYYGFLVEFPKSQVDLRYKAFVNMQMLEAEKAALDYNNQKNNTDDFELKERIARQLYIEAIRAKEAGDNYTFMRKYNTVLYSDLFKDTKTAFDLFRDKELAKLIKSLIDEIRQVRYAVGCMQRALVNKLDNLEANISDLRSTVASSRNDYSPYFDRMIDIQKEQANDWSRFANTGKGPTSLFGSPKRY